METLINVCARLCEAADQLNFSAPVDVVYNPLRYAWDAHRQYLARYGQGRKPVVLIGMNPGPFGMAQTGVPFGTVSYVRDWMGITGNVTPPQHQHPKRPILGFAIEKEEVSGTRLWRWAQSRFGTAEYFFREFFVINYCPLAFMSASGKNLTPDKLPAGERNPLYTVCDQALQQAIDVLQPEWVIGIGKFAESRARIALAEQNVRIETILHPSPASPAANRGWAEQAERKLKQLGIL